jgi:hypothetical protein
MTKHRLKKKKNKNYYTVVTIPNSNIKIIERVKIDNTTHKYMTAHLLA